MRNEKGKMCNSRNKNVLLGKEGNWKKISFDGKKGREQKREKQN